jgi:hypothetical protein
MAKEKICGIYCIQNLVNGKVYIGQSADIEKRWYTHKSELNRNVHKNKKLQNAWNKYGYAQFKFFILEKCLKCDLDELEKFYINFYDSYKNGYNKDLGGYQLRDCSESMIINMRYAQDSKPIYQINFDGNIVSQWYGAREASKKLNIEQTGIWSCLHHNRYTYKGYIWIFVDEFNSLEDFDVNQYINRPGQAKEVVQKTLDGDFVKIWPSVYQTQFDGYNSNCVWACCIGRQKTHKGFLWEYV